MQAIDNIGNGLQICKILQNERINELLQENKELKEKVSLTKYYGPILNEMDHSTGYIYVSVVKDKFCVWVDILQRTFFSVSYENLERIKYFLEKDGFIIQYPPKKENIQKNHTCYECIENLDDENLDDENTDGMDFMISRKQC